VMGLGIWLALGRRRWLAGMAVAAGALALMVVELRVVIPHFCREPYTHFWGSSALGPSLSEIAGTALLHPLRTLGVVWTGGRALYLVLMLAPLGFLPLYGGGNLGGAVAALG